MTGLGILRGLWTTLKHFVNTYIEDFRDGKKRYFTEEGVESRRSTDVEGIFTVQYQKKNCRPPKIFGICHSWCMKKRKTAEEITAAHPAVFAPKPAPAMHLDRSRH
jgi:hypothetical protein